MIRIVTITSLLLVVLACSSCDERPYSRAKIDAITAETDLIMNKLAEAVMSGETVGTDDRYIERDYIFISAAGLISTCEEMLEELRGGAAEIEEFSFTKELVNFLSGTVLVVGSGSGRGVNPGGEQFHEQYGYMAIFANKDGHWLLKAWQITPVKEA